MKKIAYSLALSAMAVAAPALIAAPAHAQAAASIIVVDLDRVIADSNAFKGASATLKPQVDSLQARAKALGTQLETEAGSLSKARETNTMAPAAFDAKIKEFQGKQTAARSELEGKQRSLQLANAYVIDQINKALDPLIKTLMTEKRAQIALAAGATIAVGPGVDVSPELLTRLNSALPRVNTTPPAGWQPGR
jgi:Skp family chaperone for outer membrane proteins